MDREDAHPRQHQRQDHPTGRSISSITRRGKKPAGSPNSFIFALMLLSFASYERIMQNHALTEEVQAMNRVTSLPPGSAQVWTTMKNVNVNVTETPPTIFHCTRFPAFLEYSFLLSSIFPEYTWVDIEAQIEMELARKRGKWRRKHIKIINYRPNSTAVDIFVNHWDNFCSEMGYRFVWQWFEGKTVTVYPEAHLKSRPKLHNDFVELGPGLSRKNHVLLTFLQVCFWMYLSPAERNQLFNARPQAQPKHFLIYAHSNCIKFREDAFSLLATIGPPVHHGGPCDGSKGSRWGIVPNGTSLARNNVKLRNFHENARFFSNYKFCLVMEHELAPGYITEKLLNAFIAGCLPIYYGTTEVFDIFSREAFVYFDPDAPRPALALVEQLNSNDTMYAAMMSKPILANGERTVEEYFSFSDEIGNGVLKKRIREMLGLDKVTFIS